MNNAKTTRKALLTSVVALVICVTMLMGTTFAWFTDTATVAVNQIVSGNLDVELVNVDGTALDDTLTFASAAETQPEPILWEPGATYFTQGFKVKNNGNLALKFKVVVTGADMTSTEDDDYNLLDVIKFELVNDMSKDATAVVLNDVSLAAYATTADTYYIKGHMDELADNNYKNLSLEGITITVYATQDTVEKDSFDENYDAGATYPVVDAAGLKETLAAGKPATLLADIVLDETLAIAADAEINLNGKTLTFNNTDADAIAVSDGAELTISGGNLDIAVEDPSYSTTYHAIAVTNDAEGTKTVVNLENVTVTLDESAVDWNDGTIRVAATAGEAVLNVGEGTVIDTDKHIVFSVGENATVNMSDGEINIDNWATSSGSTMCFGIALDEATAVFNMTGGSINTAGDTMVCCFTISNDDAKLNITGGSVNIGSKYSYLVYKFGCNNPQVSIADGVVSITGEGSQLSN